MKISQLIIGLLLLCTIPFGSYSQDRLCRVRLFPSNNIDKRNELLALLQVDHFQPNSDKSIDVEISQTDLKRLKTTAYRYEVLVPDVSRYLDSVNKEFFRTASMPTTSLSRVAVQQMGSTVDNIIRRPDAFEVKNTFAGYYKFSEMEAAMNALVAAYPSIASKTSIGKTYFGRDLWVIKISDNVATDEDEPEAFFMGLQHCREAITGASMIFFMQYLCEEYQRGNQNIIDLVNNREIFIMPCFNPDGYNYNDSVTNGNGGGSWRKNRRPTSGSTLGVDLNRNWGSDWGNCSTPIQGNATSCGSSDKTTDTYYGSSAFSERETDSLRSFTKKHHFKVAFDQHAYGPYYSIPFGRKSLHNTASTDMSPKDSNFYMALPALMGTYNGMRTANSYDALGYEVAGGFKDWMLYGDLSVKDSIWGLTGEGSAGGGNSAFGSMSSFWAPASQIVNLCKGMCYQNLQLAYSAGIYSELEDATDIALTAKTGSATFNLTRLGITDGPITVSLLPLKNMTSAGTSVTTNSLSYFQTINNTISYTLPSSITNGQQVKYVWKVQGGNITYYDTVTKIYSPTVLLSDDMNGDITTNWSTATSGAGTGDFGYSYTNGTWVFTTGGLGGTNALSESADKVNYGSQTRSYVTSKSTTLNTSDATLAYLTFSTRHRLENFRDKVQVQVSTDNGNNWSVVKGLTTIQEPGTLDGSTINGEPALTGIQPVWKQELFDLSAYKSTSLRLRFEFTSDNDPSSFKYEVDEGIYIDNLKLVKSTVNQVTLPVHVSSFVGNLQSNKSVLLNWEANITTEHDYFEVQRSADGNSFETIGKVISGATLNFTDNKPAYGNNYYRLRQVDKNGSMLYSKIINVTLNPEYSVSIYPNPVSDRVNIRMRTDHPIKATLVVTDIAGSKIHSQDVKMTTAFQEIAIDAKAWPSQVYIIKTISAHGEVLNVQKFVKN